MNNRILILGATGMLGHAVFKVLRQHNGAEVFATLRNQQDKKYFAPDTHEQLIANIDVLNQDALVDVFSRTKPDVVINCVGLIKQLAQSNDPLAALPVNSLLPHRLAHLCRLSNARLIHISTDCVFSGSKGGYTECDLSDAADLYGKSKYIGEVHDLPHVITLRTSIIGHELNSNYALINWFLTQSGAVKGYTNAVFSGLPTNELARIILDFVIPHPELSGLYHVSAAAIDKYQLLNLVAEVYGKTITITPDNTLHLDRSLDSTRFRDATGYTPPAWPDLIKQMHEFHSEPQIG